MAKFLGGAKTEEPEGPPPAFSDADKSKARQWFKKAATLREQKNFDYAIESIITGLSFWPEAVEEGHMPLWSLAIQRQQAGGKAPSMMESLKTPTSGKDALKNMLNAELLLAKDPKNIGYMEAVLKNAVKARLLHAVTWVAPKILEWIRREKKPAAARLKVYRDALVEAAEYADKQGLGQLSAFCYEHAVWAIEAFMAHNPGDMGLRDDARELSGRLTITRGKYGEGESFRESLQDADKQRIIHDSERMKQAEGTLEAVIEERRRDLEANPGVAGKINALVEALLKPERKEEEDEAIQILTAAFKSSNNYSFKAKADDIRLRQLRRETRALRDKARETGSADDKQQARLTESAEIQSEIEIFTERARQYPTDLKLRYRLGDALFRAKSYDEAIPALQAAQADPRYRLHSQMRIGLSFFQKGAAAQAIEVLREAMANSEGLDDDMEKQLLYWLARSQEADEKLDEARASYGKLLRIDYNYSDARARLEALGK